MKTMKISTLDRIISIIIYLAVIISIGLVTVSTRSVHAHTPIVVSLANTAFDFVSMTNQSPQRLPVGQEITDPSNLHIDPIPRQPGDTCITVQQDGSYLVGGRVQWELDEQGTRVLWMTRRDTNIPNAPLIPISTNYTVLPAQDFVTLQDLPPTIVLLEAGECVEINARQDGASRPIWAIAVSFWLTNVGQ